MATLGKMNWTWDIEELEGRRWSPGKGVMIVGDREAWVVKKEVRGMLQVSGRGQSLAVVADWMWGVKGREGIRTAIKQEHGRPVPKGGGCWQRSRFRVGGHPVWCCSVQRRYQIGCTLDCEHVGFGWAIDRPQWIVLGNQLLWKK